MINAIYFQLRAIVHLLMRLYFSLECDGLHYIEEQNGPVILAGNHTGWLDALIVCVACNRRVRFMVAEWVMRLPVIGSVIHLFGGIPVRPRKGAYALKEAVKCLERGENICIFPEGLLSIDGEVTEFRSGVVRLQKDSRCPVVPFAIYGSFEAWPYNRRFPHLCKIAIHFGVPLTRLDLDVVVTKRELQDVVTYMKGSLDRRFAHESDAEYQSNLLDLIQSKSDTFSARPALCLKEPDGRWNEISYAELSRRATRLSSYLIEAGINRGDHIAIVSDLCPEFAVCFFAAGRAGATVVCPDAQLSGLELQELLADCHTKMIFVSDRLIAKLEAITTFNEPLKSCFLLNKPLNGKCDWQSIEELIPTNRLPSIRRTLDEVAVITYTSGTTGRPKGVMTTFQNLIFQAKLFEGIADPKQGERFISILPLNRLLELTYGFLGVLHAGGTIYCCPSRTVSDVLALLKERHITGVIAPPSFYEDLKSAIDLTISKNGIFQKARWRFATAIACCLPTNGSCSQKLKHFLFAPWHRSFGNKLKTLFSGGAALDQSVAQYFQLIGMPILQGYGLSEASPVVSCNTRLANRIGSVGKPVSGVEVKIDSVEGDVGEIWTRGPHIMKGYYNKAGLAAPLLDKDGWFHTGDLGRMDSDGYLYIIGRFQPCFQASGSRLS